MLSTSSLLLPQTLRRRVYYLCYWFLASFPQAQIKHTNRHRHHTYQDHHDNRLLCVRPSPNLSHIYLPQSARVSHKHNNIALCGTDQIYDDVASVTHIIIGTTGPWTIHSRDRASESERDSSNSIFHKFDNTRCTHAPSSSHAHPIKQRIHRSVSNLHVRQATATITTRQRRPHTTNVGAANCARTRAPNIYWIPHCRRRCGRAPICLFAPWLVPFKNVFTIY